MPWYEFEFSEWLDFFCWLLSPGGDRESLGQAHSFIISVIPASQRVPRPTIIVCLRGEAFCEIRGRMYSGVDYRKETMCVEILLRDADPQYESEHGIFPKRERLLRISQSVSNDSINS